MGIFDIFKSKAASNPVPQTTQPADPLVMEPFQVETGRLVDSRNQRASNRYTEADALVNMDERLWSVIELAAVMVRKSYNGISLKPEGNEPIPTNTSNAEENAILEAKKFAEQIDIPGLLYNYTKDLWKYGDAVDKITFYGGNGVSKLTPLPMNLVTAIDHRKQYKQQLGLGSEVIQDPKFYVVDELNSNLKIKDQLIPTARTLHISFDNRRQWVSDNLGRWTFNVWSHSPIETLKVLIEWKHNLIRNDLLWRNRLLPREHHRLDLSVYDPSKYTGTYSTKITNAKSDATQAIKDYNDKIKRREADQGFTTGTNVDIDIIEPKTTNYTSPNQIIDQINSLISTPTGTPGALVGGESKGFTSLLHSSSFTAMRADIYAMRITSKLETLVKKHVALVRPGLKQDVIDRLFIRNKLILDRDRTELAKIIGVLVNTNVFTASEIRGIWGLDPLTERQSEEIQAVLNKPSHTDSVTEDLLRENPESPTGDMETGGQRGRNINQKGDI